MACDYCGNPAGAHDNCHAAFWRGVANGLVRAGHEDLLSVWPPADEAATVIDERILRHLK